MLRKRTDSYEYEVDQLFLGTLLFTVSAFLFPTVLTYHLLFAGVSHWEALLTIVVRRGEFGAFRLEFTCHGDT